MASRRMFNKKVIETDTFCDMSPETQLLYIHFGLNADDDGIIDNYNMLMRCYGADAENLQELINNGYVLKIDNVLIIVHWKLNNHIRNDRYNQTIYQEQYKKLTCNNGIYSVFDDGTPSGIPSGTPSGIPSGTHSIDKYSIGKYSIGKCSENGIPSGTPTKHNEKEKMLQCNTDVTPTKHNETQLTQPVTLTEQELNELCNKYTTELVNKTIDKMNNYLIEKRKTYKNYALQVATWIDRDYTPQQIEQLKEKARNTDKLKELESRYLE